jgi:hypothetical protein
MREGKKQTIEATKWGRKIRVLWERVLAWGRDGEYEKRWDFEWNAAKWRSWRMVRRIGL